MIITLEMVDDVIKRTGVSYNAAKTALETSGGDVLQAVLEIEAEKCKPMPPHSLPCIADWVKKLVQEGLVRQILVVKNDKTVLDVPIMAGAIASLVLTKSTLIAIATAFVTGCQIYLVKKDGSKVHINAFANASYETLKQLFATNENVDATGSLQKDDTVIKS